jgi:DNA recombination protein RmuC
MLIIGLLTGLILGAAAAWLVLRPAARERDDARLELASVKAELDVEQRSFDGKLAATIKAVSAEALKESNESFLALAETKLQGTVGPLKESLEKVQGQVQTFDQARERTFGALRQELATLRDGQERLKTETGALVNALRAPHVRGRWGEVQLKRVVEAAGLVEHCDFVLQSSTRDGEGALLRPDLVVRLPGGKHVVVDSKVPLAAYLDAWETQDDAVRQERLADHARQLRDHVTKLSRKEYWRQFEPTPDFVVMFLPDESFLRTAHDHDSTLNEDAWKANVIPASPALLFAILRTVAATWQQETVAQSARQVHELGQELYDRLSTTAGHFAALGKSLGHAVRHFNSTLGALESRVLVTGRRLSEHGIVGEPLPEIEPIEIRPREPAAAELVAGLEPGPRALDVA